MLGQVRNGDWIDGPRIARVSWAVLIVCTLAVIALIATSDGLKDLGGRPLGSDFFSFWSAGRVALDGVAADAFDPRIHFAAHQTILSEQSPTFYPFLYPPVFLFAALGFASLPYAAAWLTWMSLTLTGYVAAMRAIVPVKGATIVALAFPAVFVNFTHGQNGFLIAALIGGALVVLDRRPLLAGLLIGLLAFKPQFGVLIPLALAAGGYWRTFFSASLTVLALAGATTLAFGPEIWVAFMENTSYARTAVLESGGAGFEKMQSLFAALRAFGAPADPAYVAQAALAASLAVSLIWLWRGAAAFRVKAAGLIVASLLATPYVYDYDLMALGPAIGLLAMHGKVQGFRPYEKSLLAIAFFIPIISRSVAGASLAPIGFLTLLALYALIITKAHAKLAQENKGDAGEDATAPYSARNSRSAAR